MNLNIKSIIAVSLLLAAAPGCVFGQAVNAYGYDAGGQYHTDGYGSSPNLNLNTSVDVSDLKAKFQQLFAPEPVRTATPWYDEPSRDYSDDDYYRPGATTAPGLTPEQIAANQKAAELKVLVDKANDALTIKKDYPLAVTLLQNAADAGDTASLATLYNLLTDKSKGVFDKDRASKLLVDLATGHDDYRDKGQPVFSEFKKIYGLALMAGDGYPKDYDTGVGLVQSSAITPEDQITLGKEYETGANNFHQNADCAIGSYKTAFLLSDNDSSKPANSWMPEIRSRMALLMIAQPGAGLGIYRFDLIGLLKPGEAAIPQSLRDAIGNKIYGELMAGDPAPKNPNTILGLLYITQGDPDWKQALPYFTNNTDPAAVREVSQYYENGWGRPRDHQKAQALLAQAAAAGDKDASYLIAVEKYNEVLRTTKDAAELDQLAASALQCAKVLADAGNEPANNELAKWTMLRAEHSQTMSQAEKDAAKQQAFELWEAASKLGDPKATYNRARCKEYGIGTDKDTWWAVQYYQVAAQEGVPKAEMRFGEINLKGLYEKPINVQDGREYLRRAAQTLPDAANELAINIYQAGGTDYELKEARTMFQKALDGGIWAAGFNLAGLLHQGLGGDKDEARAKALLEKAAAMGGAKSAKAAVGAYTDNVMVAPDPAMAAKWKAVAGI